MPKLFKCPECGEEDEFVRSYYTISGWENGYTDTYGYTEFDDQEITDSTLDVVVCCHCGAEFGSVEDFEIIEVSPPKPKKKMIVFSKEE